MRNHKPPLPVVLALAAVLVGGALTGDRPLSVAAGQMPKPNPERVGSPDGRDNRDADREAIRNTAREFIRAFAQGDAKTLANQWTENGEYRDDSGDVVRGRAAMEKAYARHFQAKPKGQVVVDIQSIDFPSRDTAIEEGVLRFKPGGAELPTSSRYSTLHVREDGNWKIALSREWAAGRDKLHDLAWLIGQWTAGPKDHEVLMNFEWNDAKTLIRNRFSNKEGGKVIASGTQTITYDPVTGRIRSWMFEDDGGRGESIWHRDGNRWVLESMSVGPGAGEMLALNIIARVSDDEFTWRSINRMAGATKMPDTLPIKVTRIKTSR